MGLHEGQWPLRSASLRAPHPEKISFKNFKYSPPRDPISGNAPRSAHFLQRYEALFHGGFTTPHTHRRTTRFSVLRTLFPPATLLGSYPPAWTSPRRWHYRHPHCKSSRDASRSRTSTAVSPSSAGLMNSIVSSGLLMRDMSPPAKEMV